MTRQPTQAKRAAFTIADHVIAPGKRVKIELPIARLMSGTPVALPVVVSHGRQDGPVVWLSAAVHGDELCGVEIIRRVLGGLDIASLAGTVIAVPVVNVHGFNTGERGLPDGRDLNRSFPGSTRGSLAARLANLVMTEVVERCTVGIDLHTGSDHRTNLPQIRGDLDDADTLELARVFGAPLALHARLRDGSLREAATEIGATVLLFEGGEAQRFDQHAIDVGVTGIRRVLGHLGMTDASTTPPTSTELSRSSKWLRAPRSGVLHLEVELGATVAAGDCVATIYDPFGKRLGQVTAKTPGMAIAHTQKPLVNRGDAVAHIAEID